MQHRGDDAVVTIIDSFWKGDKEEPKTWPCIGIVEDRNAKE